MKQNTNGEKLYKEIRYEKVLWVGGFIKTTSSAALISMGITLILTTLNKPPFVPLQYGGIIVGIIAIISGIIVVYSIDLYRKKYKKKELEIICEEIDKKAEEIAKEKIKNSLQKIQENMKKEKI